MRERMSCGVRKSAGYSELSGWGGWGLVVKGCRRTLWHWLKYQAKYSIGKCKVMQLMMRGETIPMLCTLWWVPAWWLKHKNEVWSYNWAVKICLILIKRKNQQTNQNQKTSPVIFRKEMVNGREGISLSLHIHGSGVSISKPNLYDWRKYREMCLGWWEAQNSCSVRVPSMA